MLKLKYDTPKAWTEIVLRDLGAFLIDHAFCERKASQTALKLITHYPERRELVDAMVDLAREELEHFALVYRQITARGLRLTQDGPDPYVNLLIQAARDSGNYPIAPAPDSGPPPVSPGTANGVLRSLLDRLLVAALIEGRSCERFILITEALPPGPLKELYQELTRSEARHHGLFLGLARRYVEAEAVEARLEALLTAEAKIVASLPLRAAVH